MMGSKHNGGTTHGSTTAWAAVQWVVVQPQQHDMQQCNHGNMARGSVTTVT